MSHVTRLNVARPRSAPTDTSIPPARCPAKRQSCPIRDVRRSDVRLPLLYQMTGNLVPWGDFPQLRFDFVTVLNSQRASGAEVTPFWWV